MSTTARRRKNFLPAFLIAIFGWLGLIGVIFFISPHTKLGPTLFFPLFFLANLFTWSLVTGITKVGLFITLWSIWLLILLHKQQLNWLNNLWPLLIFLFTAILSRKKTVTPLHRKKRVK